MAQGFFNLGPMPKTEPTRKAPKSAGCDSCGLDRKGKSEPFYGECKEGILILGESPHDNTELGKPFFDERAKPLWNLEGKRFSSDILQDCSLGFTLPCATPKDKAITAVQAQACKGRIISHIKALAPRVIIAMGPVAIQALIWDRMSGRITNTNATDFIGHAIPDRELNCWIVCTYGLDYLQRQEQSYSPDRAPLLYFQQHLRKAWVLRNTPLPEIPKNIKTSRDPEVITGWIREALDHSDEVALDYETTGLKPHRKGHKIVIGSLAFRDKRDGILKAYGFQWFGDHPGLINAWGDLMTSEKVGKIAHKADFEMSWTRFRSGINNGKTEWARNWAWDTCLGAHCLDNNGKVGLKFLIYVKLGVLGYDAHIEKYLKAKPGEEEKYGCNAFNYLVDSHLPWDDLMQYCAEDALYCLWLSHQERLELSTSQIKGYNLFHEGIQTFARIQANGLPVDIETVEKSRKTIKANFEDAKKKVLNSREVKKWPGGQFSPSSNQQLGELLYDIIGIEPPNGSRDVQEATLSKIDSDFVRAILEMRRWSKLLEFLEGFVTEAVLDEETGQWLIRPNFNLSSGADSEGGGPRTFRSSSDSPNFQNIPKRDKEALKLLRSIFKAPEGYIFKEYDYKGVEVSGSACYHHDPNMITYLTDPTTDMHRDTAMDMFFRTLKTFTKGERQGAKNGYVFPTFYGATPKSMGPHMWEDMSEETRAHLSENGYVEYWDRATKKVVKIKGIKTLQHFMEHVKNVDRKFWGERFKVYGQWRKEEWERYQEDGYLETYTGFRCYGPMAFTEATNRRIQGSSFHILLQSLIWEVAQVEAMGLQSMFLGQIHDAKIALVKIEEEAQMDEIIRHNGCVRIRKEWDWIIVPLTIEHDASEPGGTWAEMKARGALTA